MNIVEFIEARIAEDEQIARKADAAQDDPLYPGTKMGLWVVTDSDFAIGVDYDPARVLRQCESVRKILELYRDAWAKTTHGTGSRHYASQVFAYGFTLKSIAAIYSDHPDYQQEWESQ